MGTRSSVVRRSRIASRSSRASLGQRVDARVGVGTGDRKALGRRLVHHRTRHRPRSRPMPVPQTRSANRQSGRAPRGRLPAVEPPVTLDAIHTGLVQAAHAHNALDLETSTQQTLQTGETAFGYASDLVGRQCRVRLGANSPVAQAVPTTPTTTTTRPTRLVGHQATSLARNSADIDGRASQTTYG